MTQKLITILWLLGICVPCARAAEFVDIGVGLNLIVNAISDDGSVVVGRTLEEDWNSGEAFFWTRTGGVNVLGTLDGDKFAHATDVSADGAVIVGTSRPSDYEGQLFRWTKEEGMKGLGAAAGFGMGLASVSGDGSTLAAMGFTPRPEWDQRAFRWTEADGFESLLPDGARKSVIGDISADGKSIGLRALGGDGSDAWTGVIWNELHGFRSLSAEFNDTRPWVVSGDGQVAFGMEGNARGNPFRWTAEDGVHWLPILQGLGNVLGAAEDTNKDGSILVGDFCGDSACVAYVWDERHATRNLREVLLSEHGFSEQSLPLLDSARGISADSMTIAGYNNAHDPTSTRREAWIIYLDKPLVSPLGDLNDDHYRDVLDLDLMSKAVHDGSSQPEFDVNSDGRVDMNDRTFWVHDLADTYFGDANLDGEFNTSDLTHVLELGKYETGQAAGWDEGDWNGDAIFGTGDFVTALIDGGYELGPKQDVAPVPEPTSALLFVIGLLGIVASGRRDQN